MNGIYTILLLIVSNAFMALAWYGHLKLNSFDKFQALPLITIILISWGIAFFEYCFQVPANRIGFRENGGPFSLFELKIMQEVISLSVFSVFALLVFKSETLKLNHILSFACLVLAVFFAFRK